VYKRNKNAGSRNYYCHETTVNTTYIFGMCVCIFSCAACKAQEAYYIVICGLSGSIILFLISHNDKIFVKKGY